MGGLEELSHQVTLQKANSALKNILKPRDWKWKQILNNFLVSQSQDIALDISTL